jgi:hypothetical protein
MGYWEDFVSIVDSQFKYLETEYGFRKLHDGINSVDYESLDSKIKIYIYLDMEREREVSLSFRRTFIGSGEAGWIENFDAFLFYLYPKISIGSKFSKYSKEESDHIVTKLAELLKTYGSKILHGDLSELEYLDDIGKKIEEESYGKTTAEYYEICRKYQAR